MTEDLSISSTAKTIAIIGGGFSGAALAINLLRHATIVLIERKPPFGGGVAYGTKSPDHLLNVPAYKIPGRTPADVGGGC